MNAFAASRPARAPSNDELVAELEKVRAEASGAEHLSILRVADIITWKRNTKGKGA
jgi:hypothetical protein